MTPFDSESDFHELIINCIKWSWICLHDQIFPIWPVNVMNYIIQLSNIWMLFCKNSTFSWWIKEHVSAGVSSWNFSSIWMLTRFFLFVSSGLLCTQTSRLLVTSCLVLCLYDLYPFILPCTFSVLYLYLYWSPWFFSLCYGYLILKQAIHSVNYF